MTELIKNNYFSNEKNSDLLIKIIYFIYLNSEHFIKKTSKIIIKSGIIPILIDYLEAESDSQKLFSLRILGNICTGSADDTKFVVTDKFIDILKYFLDDPNFSYTFKKEVLWIISNLSIDSPVYIKSFIDKGFYLIFIKIFTYEIAELKKEAIWAVCNLTNHLDPYTLNYLINNQLIEILFKIIQTSTPRYVLIGLEAIQNLLAIDEMFTKVNFYSNNYSMGNL